LGEATSGDTLATTSDGGKTWAVVNFKVAGWELLGLNCPEELTCLAVGRDGLIMVSRDGGQTWQQPKSPTDSSLWNLSCASPQFCMASGRSGLVIITEDGGQTWRKQTVPARDLDRVVCPGDKICYIYSSSSSSSSLVSGNKLYVTKNGGNTWELLNYGSKDTLYDLSCPDQDHCFVVLSQRRLVRATSDGGKTWTEQDPHLDSYIQGMSCPTKETCYLLTTPYLNY
jgi:photosystem II stability/assembly factor-like uncharacterized protein